MFYPGHREGTISISNLQLLHRHGHDNKTHSDLKRYALSGHCFVEELDEGKLSRLVLKTSWVGDGPT